MFGSLVDLKNGPKIFLMKSEGSWFKLSLIQPKEHFTNVNYLPEFNFYRITSE